MYRSPSPFAPPGDNTRDFYPTSQAVVTPGSLTYTTSTGPDGRQIYHPFKAVPASYQTSSGLVTGIQWMPVESTSILPTGAMPASADFAASWKRGYKEDKTSDWGRNEEKQRKKDEKDAKRQREEHARVDHDQELRKARERDAQARERRKSFNAGTAPGPYAFPTPGGGTGYPAGPYAGGGGYSASTGGHSDLDRQFGELDLGRDREYGGLGRPRKYSSSEAGGERPRSGRPDTHNPYGAPTGPYNSSMRSTPSGAAPHHRAASPNMRAASPNPNMRAASPNMRAGEIPYLPTNAAGYPGSNFSSSPARGHANALPRSTTPFGAGVYPPGHVLEGQAMSRSRPPSPMPGGPGMPFPRGASPRMPGGMSFPSESTQLAAPEGFSRPVNMALPFTNFPDTFLQGMNRFYEAVPRMPNVLQTHDVLDDDWMRLMKDVALAWANRLPVPELSRDGHGPKNSTLVADLVDLWNVSFFLPRGVELVLYRGRERRTGQRSGTIERDVPDFDESDDDLSLTDSEDISDNSASDHGAGRYNSHGRMSLQDPLAEVFEMGRQRRAAAKADRKKKRQERHRRRRERKRDRKYWLCVTSVPMVGAGYMNAGGYAGSGGGGYGMRGGGGGAY